jgi:isopenicillin N synthase-like dioxygenase
MSTPQTQTHVTNSQAPLAMMNSTPSTVREVPTLSLRDFTEGTDKDRILFIDALYTGLKDYGFIILKDHNVSQELIDRGYQLLEKLYNLPTEAKLKYHLVEKGGQRGYTPFGKEHAKDSPVMDLKEFWHVGQFISQSHPLSNYYPANVWPTELPEFETVFTELYKSLEEAGKAMLQALTFPLELPHHYFENMVDEGNSILRLLHYPPIPNSVDPRCVRAAAHEDINLITILPAATQAGLQLKDRDGQWLDVIAAPGTLIVDAGDMLARITNEVIPSTTHRVINPSGPNVSRYSMPFFMHPQPEAILSCIPKCRGEGAKYADISSHEFLMQRLREIGLIK